MSNDRERKDLGLPRSFLWVLGGQLLSLLGTQLTGFCLGVVILKETGSVTQFSLFSAAVLMPAFCLHHLSARWPIGTQKSTFSS